MNIFDRQVFINCPFDDDYYSLLRPLLFTVIYLGYIPRIASERLDSGENRIDKIGTFMRESRYSIHDLSRMKSTTKGQLQRMNMPFELGIDYGLRISGNPEFANKQFLILASSHPETRNTLS